MIIENPPKWQKVSVVLVIVVVIIAGLFFSVRYLNFGKYLDLLSASQKKIDYVIPGVPYIGNYNHTGKYSQFSNFTSESTASIDDYWYPGESDYSNISGFFNKIIATKSFIGAQDVSDYFVRNGKYSAKIEHLQLGDLKKYINPNTRTPLLVFLALDADQPMENPYSPLALIIGIKESEQSLVLHDVWMGNNFEISFDEFNRRLERMRPEWRNNYIVVQPIDLTSKLKEIQSRSSEPYPARTQTMEKAQDLFRNYAIGSGAKQTGQNDSAFNYFMKVKNDPDYEEFFPLVFKVNLTAYLAEAYSMKNDFGKALELSSESISLNHDLDKPFKDWAGYELGSNISGHYGESSIPYRVQGDICLAMKDYQKAGKSYVQALVIKPNNSLASAGLASAEAALGKK